MNLHILSSDFACSFGFPYLNLKYTVNFNGTNIFKYLKRECISRTKTPSMLWLEILLHPVWVKIALDKNFSTNNNSKRQDNALDNYTSCTVIFEKKFFFQEIAYIALFNNKSLLFYAILIRKMQFPLQKMISNSVKIVLTIFFF